MAKEEVLTAEMRVGINQAIIRIHARFNTIEEHKKEIYRELDLIVNIIEEQKRAKEAKENTRIT